MATPTEKYAVDYTDGYGLKWTKQIKDIYPAIGFIDESISLSRYDNDILKTVYRKPTAYNALYDNSINFGGAPGQSPNVVKYAARSGYPTSSVNINTVIINANDPDGAAYSIGINEDSTNPIDRGYMRDVRLLRDAEYNKMLFKVQCREMSFTEHSTPIQKNNYDDPGFTDVSIGDVDDAKYYGLYHHAGAKVWNGSSWDDYTLSPIMLCTGEDNQTFQGGGSAFNNLFNNYWMLLGSGQNIEFGNASSNYFWSAQNFQSKMYNDRYCLGWNDSYDYRPTFADDPDAAYNWCRQWMLDNSVPRNVTTYFELCREVHEISADTVVLLTVQAAFYFNNADEFVMASANTYTFPMLKGSSLTKLIAGYGLYYLSDNNASLTGITPDSLSDSSYIWLGEMSADGTTTGNWIKGSDIDSYTGYNKDGNIINPGYDPSGGGGSGGDEDNKDPINTTGAPFAAGLCNYYAMTAGSPLLDHISEALGTWDIENTHKDLYKNLVSCKLIKPPAPIPTSGSAPFTIYGVKPQYEGADISLPVVSGNPEATFGPYSVPRKFGDFRDYAPYTRASIYLPYCGWCDLPSHVVGKQVSVKYFTDIIAATCKSVVFCGNNIVAEAAGVIGLDIPFVADNVGAKMQAVTAGMIAALGGGIQLGAGIGTMVSTKSGSGAKAALSGASQYLSGYSQMAMAFNENTTEISGKNGDGCCLAGATNIIIKIVRPKKGAYTTAPFTPPGYGHNVGFVSQKQVKVSSVSGLLIADNVDTSGISGATEAERAEIKRVLETGLIVNAAPE